MMLSPLMTAIPCGVKINPQLPRKLLRCYLSTVPWRWFTTTPPGARFIHQRKIKFVSSRRIPERIRPMDQLWLSESAGSKPLTDLIFVFELFHRYGRRNNCLQRRNHFSLAVQNTGNRKWLSRDKQMTARKSAGQVALETVKCAPRALCLPWPWFWWVRRWRDRQRVACRALELSPITARRSSPQPSLSLR